MADDDVQARDGFRIVLTADRSLMANYRALLDGMVSTSQTTRTPGFLMKWLLAPAVPSRGLRAARAPMGLRRVEAALLAGGWQREQVAVVPPRALPSAVGPATEVIGVSSGDPLGIGMNSSTMSGILGGSIYTGRWFRELMGDVAHLRLRAPLARVVCGGPGAWQLVQEPEECSRLGVDHIITGYCEANVSALFAQVAGAERVSRILEGQSAHAADLPTISGPTVMGTVEISRGCGLGCRFCALAGVPMQHLPPQTILADAAANAATVDRASVPLSLVTEDLLRYGATNNDVNPGALLDLLERLRATPGVGMIQVDHANVASVAAYGDVQLRRVADLLTLDGSPRSRAWINIGVETASGELLRRSGGGGKMATIGPEQWADVCAEQIRRLEAAGFMPFVSLVMGLPQETREDVRRTLEWVRGLRGMRAAVFPLYYAPVNGRDDGFGDADLTREHWNLLAEAYKLNFKWVPRITWDNQRRAGVPLWRRLLLQALGRANVLWWKSLFALRKLRGFK